MCVIIHLEPSASIHDSKIENAVYNNPHGWGLIVLSETFKDGILVKKSSENDDTDPDDIIKVLNLYKDYERVLHLRWATVGDTSDENIHPFVIYDMVDENDSSYQAWFMHNGTLPGYGQRHHSQHEWRHGVDDNLKSDSNEFASLILEPLLSRWDGDYTDNVFKKVLDKFWFDSSRGIIISNYSEVLKFGNGWTKFDNAHCQGDVYVSNTTYFHNVQRGPENERRKKQLELERAKLAANNKNNVIALPNENALTMVDWKDFKNPPLNFHKLNSIFKNIDSFKSASDLLEVVRSLTNDEVLSLIRSEYLAMKEDDFDPTKSVVYALLLSYVCYFNIFVEECEKITSKTAKDILNESPLPTIN